VLTRRRRAAQQLPRRAPQNEAHVAPLCRAQRRARFCADVGTHDADAPPQRCLRDEPMPR